MKKIFKKAGIEKKDLLDKEFAPVLFEKILLELNQDTQGTPQDTQGTPQEEKKIQRPSENIIVQNKNAPPPPPNLNIPPPPSILLIPKPPVINLAAPPKLEVSAAHKAEVSIPQQSALVRIFTSFFMYIWS